MVVERYRGGEEKFRVPNTEYDPKIDPIVGLAMQMEEDGPCYRAAKTVRHLFTGGDAMTPLDVLRAVRFTKDGRDVPRDVAELVMERDITRNTVHDADSATAARLTAEKQKEYQASARQMLDAAYAIPATDIVAFYRDGEQKAAMRCYAAKARKFFAGQEFTSMEALKQAVSEVNFRLFGVDEDSVRTGHRETIRFALNEDVVRFPSPFSRGKEIHIQLMPTRHANTKYRLVIV